MARRPARSQTKTLTQEVKEQTASLLHEWSENTSCHGIPDWRRSQHWSRWFWAVLVLLFMFLAIYQIHGLVCDFRKEPHYVTNIYGMEAAHSEFPNVTVCNLNRINFTKASEAGYNLSTDAISHLFLSQLVQYDLPSLSFSPTERQDPLSEDLTTLEQQSKAWNQFWSSRAQTTDVTDLFRELGHSCQETLQMCMFGADAFDCCRHATAILNSEFGLCWSVTPPIRPGAEAPLQLFPGIHYGLKMFISPGLDHYANDAFYNNYLQEGVVLIATWHPESFWFDDRLVVSPGTRVAVQLENKMHAFRKPEFQIYTPECSFQMENLYTKGNYTLSNCLADCMLHSLMIHCNCVLVGEVKTTKYKTCTPDQVISCLFPKLGEVLTELGTNEGSSDFYMCTKSCQSPCGGYKEIKMSATGSVFPAAVHVKHVEAYFKRVMKQTYGISDFQVPPNYVKSWITAELYFPSRGYVMVESEAKVAIFSLIGNIGGQFGIWLGASIVTVVQAIYYVILFAVRKSNAATVAP